MSNLSISNKKPSNMTRLALSFLLFLSLLSFSLARLHPDTPEKATHYIIVPVESSSDGQSLDNLVDVGYSLRHLISHGRRHHHHHHGYGGHGDGQRYGERFLEEREGGMDVNPALRKPDGEGMEVPSMPMHVKHRQDKEMSEEYVKSDRAKKLEEDELSEGAYEEDEEEV